MCRVGLYKICCLSAQLLSTCMLKPRADMAVSAWKLKTLPTCRHTVPSAEVAAPALRFHGLERQKITMPACDETPAAAQSQRASQSSYL